MTNSSPPPQGSEGEGEGEGPSPWYPISKITPLLKLRPLGLSWFEYLNCAKTLSDAFAANARASTLQCTGNLAPSSIESSSDISPRSSGE